MFFLKKKKQNNKQTRCSQNSELIFQELRPPVLRSTRTPQTVRENRGAPRSPVATRWVFTPRLSSLDWWLAYLWAAVLLLCTLLFKSCETRKMKPHCLRHPRTGVGKLSGKGQTRSLPLQAILSPPLNLTPWGKSSRTACKPGRVLHSCQTNRTRPVAPPRPNSPWASTPQSLLWPGLS